MFLCKFLSKNGDSNFILKENEELYGFSINEKGIGKFQSNILDNIKKDLFMNDRCYKIFEHKGYEVYYDKYTGFKHFLRNGIEDLHLFFENNGSSAIMPLANKKENKDLKTKIFKIGSCTLISSLLALTYFLPQSLVIKDYIHYNHEYKLQDVVDIDKEHAMNMIKKYISESPNLSEEDKKLLLNSELLELVVPYYGDNFTEMMLHFKNITMKYTPISEDETFKELDAIGYVNQLEPNVINIAVSDNEQLKNDDNFYGSDAVKIHEFVHVLQDYNEYEFLREGVATIIEREIIGDNPYNTSYYNDTYLLEILMDVIGREPILRASFGGDSSMLENILADNLSLVQYGNFINLLHKFPGDFSNEDKQEMYGLIKQLYSNRYGCNLEVNSDIMVELFYASELNPNENLPINTNRKRYFIDHPQKDDYTIVINCNIYEGIGKKLIDKGIVYEQEMRSIKMPISYEEYAQQKSNEIVFDKDDRVMDINVEEDLCIVVLPGGTKGFSIEEAVEKGYLMPCINYNDSFERNSNVMSIEAENDLCIVDGEGYTIKEAVEKGYITPYVEILRELNDEIPDNCIGYHTVKKYISRAGRVFVRDGGKVTINIPCNIDRFSEIDIEKTDNNSVSK